MTSEGIQRIADSQLELRRCDPCGRETLHVLGSEGSWHCTEPHKPRKKNIYGEYELEG